MLFLFQYQPGYHVENKSIEIVIKNQPFTPYNLTTYTRYNHETGESYTYESTQTINLYYIVGVKGHFGNDSDWKSVGGIFSYSEGPQSNAQLDSEYTVIAIKADDYSKDAVLDFRVQTLTGYYVAYWRGLIIFGYDFYGQEGDWSATQTSPLGESQTPTPSPAATSTPTPPNFGPTSSPSSEPALTQEQLEIIIGVAIAAAVIGAGLGLLIYITKRK